MNSPYGPIEWPQKSLVVVLDNIAQLHHNPSKTSGNPCRTGRWWNELVALQGLSPLEAPFLFAFCMPASAVHHDHQPSSRWREWRFLWCIIHWVDEGAFSSLMFVAVFSLPAESLNFELYGWEWWEFEVDLNLAEKLPSFSMVNSTGHG